MRYSSGLVMVFLVMGMFLATTLPAQERPKFSESNLWRQTVLGTGSGVVSLIYSPVKLLYASGATVAGGLVLAFTDGDDKEVASRIVRRGVRGDWWVHPDVFTGNRELRFIGSID